MMMIQSEEDYYNLIGREGSHILLLGEIGEQWTTEALAIFEKSGIKINFFPWDKIEDLRLNLEIVTYPVVQLWTNGAMKREVIGYQFELLKNLANRYFQTHQGKNYEQSEFRTG
jgi:hypothetical protein